MKKMTCATLFALLWLSCGAGRAEILSLAGDWRCELAPANAAAYARELAGNSIRLPGTIDAAGIGPKNTKPPTLAGPYRIYDYAGPVWYQREVEIPAAWQGKRVTLFLERCRWTTRVWLDEKPCGTRDSLIAPHVYDLGTAVAPGKHRLTICVDNTVKIDLGVFVSALFGGTTGNLNGIIGRIELAATPPVWIEQVQVYPGVDRRVARVAVEIGNATGKPGRGALQVAWAPPAAEKQVGWAPPTAKQAGGKTVEATWDEQGGRAEIEVDMGEAKLWDEFTPQLQQLTVRLGEHQYTVRFGMRKLAVRGTQFTLNGRPVFLRGTLECSVFPLTGCPPTDVPPWQRIYRIMKSYGLNHIRFHSWCPPESAFAAADLEGIMIQAEGPQANVEAGRDPRRDAFIEAEFQRMVDTYGNHPSFCTMTLGNEYGGKPELLARWVDMLIRRDPRHLYSSASAAQTTPNRQFTETPAGRGVHSPGTAHDLRGIVAAEGRPIIGHEIGQWTFFPNFDEMKKYTGVFAPKNFELVRDALAKHHLLDLAPKYVEATGKHAVLLYKEEIELLLRSPGYGGFSLLDLHDYPTQGTALVGPLDPFWDSKGIVAPAEFRRFCGPTVPLVRMAKRTFTVDEPFAASVDVTHFGPAALPGVRPEWKIQNQAGRVIAAGTLPALDIPTGALTHLGEIRASLAQAAAPAKLTVLVSLHSGPLSLRERAHSGPLSLRERARVRAASESGQPLGDSPLTPGPSPGGRGETAPPTPRIENDWEIWVYPAKSAVAAPAGVTVAREWDEAAPALAAGRKVVLFPRTIKPAASRPGGFLPVFWSPVWFPGQTTMGILCDPQHPALAGFPTEFHSNWQWWSLLQHSRTLVLDDTPAAFRPIVQVIDHLASNRKLGNLFEARVGPGRLLVCTMDLPIVSGTLRVPLANGTRSVPDTSDDPAARQFLRSLYAYAGSPAFDPPQELDAGLLASLFSTPPSTLKKLGAKVLRVDSEDTEHGNLAAHVLDGDPETFWHTKWDPAPDPMPHELVIDLGREVKLAGLTYLPRQDQANGRIGQCDVLADGKLVSQVRWPNTSELQTLRFKTPVAARQLTLRIRSEVGGNPFAAIAELDVLVE
jgi:hypothetical protein